MPADFNLGLLVPELAIVTMVAMGAVLEIFLPELNRRFSARINLLGILFVGLTLATGFFQSPATTLQGMFVRDPFSIFFKFLFLGTAASIFIMKQDANSAIRGPEFSLLLWSTLLGMFFLVSSKDFLLFFVSLELLTLSLYILAAYSKHDLLSIEAGLKYLVLGSLASAFMVYGISLLYAASGTLSFTKLGEFAGSEGRTSLLFLAGILLVLSALGFKVASVPFHVWVPDVYQGAPTPVVAFFSVASKSAGFAALLRILLEVIGPFEKERRLLFALFSALTLLYGNLGALVQKDIKRLLGYSSIGHAGFLLVAVAAARPQGKDALLYYLIAYAVTNLAAFLVVSIVEDSGGTQIEALKGLSERSPLLAAGMFLAFLSLAGVPPLAGFFAKFFILLAAARAGFLWLVLLGAINVAISLYYYLSVIRVVYFEKARVETPIAIPRSSRILLYTLMAGIVVVGIWQAPFFRIASQAAAVLF